MSKDTEEMVQAIQSMRIMSNATGTVYEFQTEQLKRLAKLSFDPHSVVISIITSAWIVVVTVPAKTADDKVVDYFTTAVKYLLGDNWKVHIELTDGPTTAKPTTDARRVKRTRTVSKQSGRGSWPRTKNKR